jgi:voltage-gated potassium channel
LVERGQPGATIQSVGDGLWWAITTLTTVGYGDIYPTTTEGRFIAVGLMVSGICVLGVISATVAAWFVRITQNESEKS